MPLSAPAKTPRSGTRGGNGLKGRDGSYMYGEYMVNRYVYEYMADIWCIGVNSGLIVELRREFPNHLIVENQEERTCLSPK